MVKVNRLSVMLCLFLLLGLFLSSCGQSTLVENNYRNLVTLKIDKNANKADIEKFFEGKINSWYPDAGIATVATNQSIDPTNFNQQGLVFEGFRLSNVESVDMKAVVPVMQNGSSAWANGSSAWANGSSAWANGSSAWANGSSAWANGSSAWANGSSAWANGSSAWANGVIGGYFKPNKSVFEQINLFETHMMSKNLGEGIKVAVIDTGLDYQHPMFTDRLAPQEEWIDFVDNDNTPDEYLATGFDSEATANGWGHGTAVAGIILQVAPRATILPIRVIDNSGTGDTDQVAKAIEWAVLQGADVINLSLGTNEVSGIIEAMLVYAHNNGVLTIASAGNTGEAKVLFPANVENVSSIDLADFQSFTTETEDWSNKTSILGIGSVDANDILSSFSSHGKSLDLTAPGEGIATAYPYTKFSNVTGTSFAAPLVTGTLALALAESDQQIARESMLDVLIGTTENISDKNNGSDLIGSGRLDTYNFMKTGLNWPDIATVEVEYAHPVPGIVDAAAFREGKNIGYLDNTARDPNISEYSACRTDTDVDTLLHGTNACKITNTEPGEWLSYKIKVTESGKYDVKVSAGAPKQGGFIALEVDGLKVMESQIPQSYSYWTMKESLFGSVELTKGTHTIKLVMLSNGPNNDIGDIDFLSFERQGSVTVPTEPTQPTEPTKQPSEPTQPVQPEPTQPEPTQPSEPQPSEPTQPQGSAWQNTPATIPGIIEAENFDIGGQSVAFYDNDFENKGTQWGDTCRSKEAVDTGKFGADGCKLIWTQPGEWLTYTVDVSNAGSYIVSFAGAAAKLGGYVAIEVNGKIVGQGQIQATGWDNFAESNIGKIELSEGRHVVKLIMLRAGPNGYIGDIDYINFTEDSSTKPIQPSSTPYSGSPVNLPAKIEAEHFDNGGIQVAYFDNDYGNNSISHQNICRKDTDVDTAAFGPDLQHCKVNWNQPGEWLNYTIQVKNSATYTISVAASSPSLGGNFSININDNNLSGAVPNTGGWNVFKEISLGSIYLPRGIYTLKLSMDSNGSSGYIGDFDYINIEKP